MILTNDNKDKVKLEIREAIRNSNRCLYSWTVNKKLKRIGYNDAKGMVKSWLIRTLKSSFGYADINSIFRDNELIVTLDEKGDIFQIHKLRITRYSEYGRKTNENLELFISETLKELDYTLLHYSPSDSTADMSQQRFTSDFFISLSELENFNFKNP